MCVQKLKGGPSQCLKIWHKMAGSILPGYRSRVRLGAQSSAFQMVSDAVTYVMPKRHHKIFANIDEAHKAFNDLFTLLEDLGLPISMEKLHSPCRSLTCLGIGINLVNNTLSIEHSKLQDIYLECVKFNNKKYVTNKAFQSLFGKLIYIHKCVSPARVFINHMLALFRNNYDKKRIHLTAEFFKDLAWFLSFLPQFNGISFITK